MKKFNQTSENAKIISQNKEVLTDNTVINNKRIFNETPVRTANNFGINNIELEYENPQIREFYNVMLISADVDKLKFSNIRMGVMKSKLSSKIGLELNKNYTLDITVPENVKIDNPITIMCEFDEDNVTLVDNIRIILEKNAHADFILKYDSSDCDNDNCVRYENCTKGANYRTANNFNANTKSNYKIAENLNANTKVSKINSAIEEQNNINLANSYFHYLKQETIANEGTSTNIVIANMLNDNSNSFIAIENKLETNAKVEHTLIEFGGKNKISNYNSIMKGNNSENNIKTIYLGKHNDIIDINYNIEELGESAKCNIEIQGAISDNSKKNFKGVIDFKKGCKKAKGFENENCTILSPTAKSKSLPVLLCHEEDVEGQHGVASGKIDEKKLFYIMTKGISYEDAKKLIVKANFSKIIKNIKDENLQNDIMQKIDQI